jgi:hypothetical protein
VSPGLERVRRAAKLNKEERFTALLHHVDVALLRQAYFWLKPEAAPGVDTPGRDIPIFDHPSSRINASRSPEPARLGRDGLGVTQKAPVWGAAWTGRQTFICQRQGNIALTGAQGRLGQGPVHDVALRVAAADLP